MFFNFYCVVVLIVVLYCRYCSLYSMIWNWSFFVIGCGGEFFRVLSVMFNMCSSEYCVLILLKWEVLKWLLKNCRSLVWGDSWLWICCFCLVKVLRLFGVNFFLRKNGFGWVSVELKSLIFLCIVDFYCCVILLMSLDLSWGFLLIIFSYKDMLSLIDCFVKRLNGMFMRYCVIVDFLWGLW